MTFKGMMAAAAALGLASAPVAAQAVERATAPAAGQSELGGDARAIAPIFAILVFVAFLFAAAGEDDPASP